MSNAWESREMHAGLWYEYLYDRDLGIKCRIILRWIVEK